MATSFSFDDLEIQPPPPPLLYKYLSPDRVENVLAGKTVRFTPLMGTNDSFEVRKTFDQFAGPKFQHMLAEQMDAVTTEESIERLVIQQLRENGLDASNPKLVIELLRHQSGGDFLATIRDAMQQMVETTMIPMFNSSDSAMELLEKFASGMLCFSLSERPDVPPMWAHYAADHSGFVVAFKTNNSFFITRSDGSKNRLLKVKYFDGKISEPLDDPYAAFISKTADWSYEREWRLYSKAAQSDMIFEREGDPIHLFKFPSTAIERVIVGSKTSRETISQLRSIIANTYFGVGLFRAEADRSSHSYIEIPI